jgi:hypothetical protein
MTFLQQSSSNKAPLDELIVAQLSDILHCEKQLQQRYENVEGALSLDDSRSWASEVWNLRLRADRLGRMLDALEGNYVPLGPFEKTTLAAA